ncbi:hypothetical protein [Bacillus sp. KH172YL63]|uniref:hypothetical protein n=1 Tax=Bacillus sp. KH172YL63 TaxID=2709784 RepID=UPI0013E446C6|nr:hypothetical protein [Bacillus sp. KH172YL63]BCB04024.1 hypothetical protein KH172YL63_21570 [Bacillus sp. KH172YL63]
MNLRIYKIVHIALTGILTIPVTLFFASGGLGENYTGNLFVYPQFLLVNVVWLAGAVLCFYKNTMIAGLILTALFPMLFIVNVLIVVLK